MWATNFVPLLNFNLQLAMTICCTILAPALGQDCRTYCSIALMKAILAVIKSSSIIFKVTIVEHFLSEIICKAMN